MGVSNQNALMGLRPVSDLSGTLHPGVEYGHVPKSNTQDLYVGMLVKLTGTGAGGLPVASGEQSGGANQPEPYHNNEGLYPDVAYFAPADTGDVYGVIVGFEYDPDLSKNGTKYLPAGTEGLVRVNTDPEAIYEIAVNTTLDAADAGLNAKLTAPAAVPTYGLPGVQIDAATKATTADLPLRLLRPKNAPGNDITVANAIWYVRVNTSERFTRTGIA